MTKQMKYFFTADIDLFKSKVKFLSDGEEMTIEEAIEQGRMEYSPDYEQSVTVFERVSISTTPRQTDEERIEKLKLQ